MNFLFFLPVRNKQWFMLVFVHKSINHKKRALSPRARKVNSDSNSPTLCLNVNKNMIISKARLRGEVEKTLAGNISAVNLNMDEIYGRMFHLKYKRNSLIIPKQVNKCFVSSELEQVGFCCVTLTSLCQPGGELYQTSVLWLLQMHTFCWPSATSEFCVLADTKWEQQI